MMAAMAECEQLIDDLRELRWVDDHDREMRRVSLIRFLYEGLYFPNQAVYVLKIENYHDCMGEEMDLDVTIDSFVFEPPTAEGHLRMLKLAIAAIEEE